MTKGGNLSCNLKTTEFYKDKKEKVVKPTDEFDQLSLNSVE